MKYYATKDDRIFTTGLVYSFKYKNNLLHTQQDPASQNLMQPR
jgi:hypothetical protein